MESFEVISFGKLEDQTKVIQIQAVYSLGDEEVILYALCLDGTIWCGRLTDRSERAWIKLTLPNK